MLNGKVLNIFSIAGLIHKTQYDKKSRKKDWKCWKKNGIIGLMKRNDNTKPTVIERKYMRLMA